MFHIDLEQGTTESGRLSLAESDVSEYFTDCSHEDHVVTSCLHSNTFGCYPENDDHSTRSMSSPEESVVCRICQLEVGSDGPDLMELGCSCKRDLAYAHQVCAESWFKLKGDKVCEICHSVARNVEGGNERIEEEVEVVVEEGGGAYAVLTETRESWCERRSMLIIVSVCWILVFLMYIFQSNFKLSSRL